MNGGKKAGMAVVRLKRKACEEPPEGLVIALKKPKCNLSENEVFFKFAATVNSEKESVKDHIQAALTQERILRYSKWRDPKRAAVSQNTVTNLRENLKAERKAANEKKKLDRLNNRRLIFAETVPVDNEEKESQGRNAEVRQLFYLYDIIEENEEIRKQCEEVESIITCNNTPLIREKVEDYVYDVYIADSHMDHTFIDNTISVRPCTLTAEDIYSGGSSDSEECYEDEDDSNDENNWRNDYPDEESSSEKDIENESDDCIEKYDDADEVDHMFQQFDLDDDDDDDQIEEKSFDYSKVFEELKDEFDGDEFDNED